MEVLSNEKEKVCLSLSKDELTLINNSLNETLSMFDDSEFSVRLGLEKEFARELLGNLGIIFDGID